MEGAGGKCRHSRKEVSGAEKDFFSNHDTDQASKSVLIALLPAK